MSVTPGALAARQPAYWRKARRRYAEVTVTSRGAVLALSAIVLVTKGIGFMRGVVLAARFGTSNAVAAFVVVSGVQAIMALVLADAVGIGVAVLVARKQASLKSALGFALGLATLTAVAQVAMASLVAGPLTSHQTYLTAEVQRALVWTAAGSGGIVLMGGVAGVLIAKGRLQLSGWLSAFAAFGTLIALISLGSPEWAIYGGWTVAMVAVPLVAAIAMSGGPRQLVRSVRFNFRYLAIAGPVALATLVSQGSFLIERRFAAPLGATAVASIGYAQQIATVPLGILIGSLGTWALHAFLERGKEGTIPLRRAYYRTMALTLSSTTAMLLVFVVFAGPIVAVLLERGQFSASDVQSAALALRGFAIGLPAMGGYLICLRAAQARKRYTTIILSAAAGLGVTIGTVSSFTSAWGVFGVLLATSVGNWVAFAILGGAVSFDLRHHDGPSGTTNWMSGLRGSKPWRVGRAQ